MPSGKVICTKASSDLVLSANEAFQRTKSMAANFFLGPGTSKASSCYTCASYLVKRLLHHHELNHCRYRMKGPLPDLGQEPERNCKDVNIWMSDRQFLIFENHKMAFNNREKM